MFKFIRNLLGFGPEPDVEVITPYKVEPPVKVAPYKVQPELEQVVVQPATKPVPVAKVATIKQPAKITPATTTRPNTKKRPYVKKSSTGSK
jgi:hypothetical protein